MSWSRFDLGAGVIVVPGLDLIWDQVSDLVDVVEVEPQTMWRSRPGGWDLVEPAFQWVEALGRPTLVHGVGFPVGGCHPPDPAGVALTAECAARLGAAHWSEHLSFNRTVLGNRSIDAGFLLPPAQTAAGVEVAAEHVRAYHTAAHLPFLVETGVNYLRPRPGELSDGAYIAGVAGRADCGILLDLHNLLTNERNGRQPVSEVLDELPLERVLEVHVAGGFEAGGYYLDAHVGAPDEELLALTASVIPRLPNLRAVLYEAVPESLAALGAAGVREILVALHRLLDGARRAKGQDRQPRLRQPRPRQPRPRQPRPRQHGPRRQRPGAAPGGAGLAASAEWERALAAYTSRASDDRPADDPGIGLLRQLADAARRGGLALACPDQLGRLIAELGLEATERLVDRYLRDRRPLRWTADEGAQFVSWLAETEPALLAEAAATT
jgi:uncharacterized protein